MKRTGFTLSEWIHQANHSKNYENFKLYVLEIYDDNERFIKNRADFHFCTTKVFRGW